MRRLTMTNPVNAICFDAYGTLFDVYCVGQQAEDLFPGQGELLAKLWRDKQVEYTRLRSMAGEYKPFWDITIDALDYCSEALGLRMNAEQRDSLLEQYSVLEAFPENLQALQRLKESGYPLAIHSNGNPEMIAKAVESAGMTGCFDTILSAHAVKRYKVDPAVYQLAPDHFGCPAKEIVFVSSNGWDIAGAAWFGFQTFWVNRQGHPLERLEVKPQREGRTLTEVADWLCNERWNQ